MERKICTKCGVGKDVDEFYVLKNGKLHSWCNDCRRRAKKIWYDNNSDHIKEYNTKNRERDMKQGARYRALHREELRIKSIYYNGINREYRAQKRLLPENKNRVAARGREWRHKNRERYNRYFQEYYEKYPEKKIARNLRSRLVKLIRGKTRRLHTNELVGCEWTFLKRHLESQFDVNMSWSNYGTYWHVDHIRPCQSFRLHNIEEQRACFHWTNLRPLEGAENISKNAKFNGVDYKNTQL